MLAVALAALVFSQVYRIEQFTASYDGGQGTYRIAGFRPVGGAPGSHPVYLYTTGTTMNYWGNDAQAYTRWLAERGVVAASVDYPLSSFPALCAIFQNKASSIYSGTNAQSALRVVCALSWSNCTAGIIVSGMSQGAQISSMAANYASPFQVSGVYEMGGGYSLGAANGFSCLRYENLRIDNTRIRSGVGENDYYFGNDRAGVMAQQRIITGRNCTVPNCIAADGSGWNVVLSNQPASGTAMHCYCYQSGNCRSPYNLDPNYVSTTAVWGFNANMNWLLSKVTLPPLISGAKINEAA